MAWSVQGWGSGQGHLHPPAMSSEGADPDDSYSLRERNHLFFMANSTNTSPLSLSEREELVHISVCVPLSAAAAVDPHRMWGRGSIYCQWSVLIPAGRDV